MSEQQYRRLGPDEVVQAGDQRDLTAIGDRNGWMPVHPGDIGKQVGPMGDRVKFRRPVQAQGEQCRVPPKTDGPDSAWPKSEPPMPELPGDPEQQVADLQRQLQEAQREKDAATQRAWSEFTTFALETVPVDLCLTFGGSAKMYLASAIEKLRAERDRLAGELDQARIDALDRIANLEQERDRLQRELAGVNTDLRIVRATRDRLQAECQRKDEALRLCVASIGDLDAIIAGEVSNDWADHYGHAWNRMSEAIDKARAALAGGYPAKEVAV
jgi:hypothetical protein